jgi:hypothetical protein
LGESSVLSYNNANSAVTTTCTLNNEICIFRREEVFKVFIHETIHAFNLDFSLLMKDDIRSKLNSMFFIKSDFNIYETYAEVWAEILNVVFIAVDTDNSKKIDQMLMTEIDFSINQMSKVLAYMGLTYNDIITNKDKSLKIYTENTNIFCYYILKAVLIYYWKDFIEWCGEKNGIDCIFKFKANKHNMLNFIEFIGKCYRKNDFINRISALASTKYVSKYFNTMRMTILEYF